MYPNGETYEQRVAREKEELAKFIAAPTPKHLSAPLDEEIGLDLGVIDQMDAPALRTLLKRIGGHSLKIGLMTKQEIGEAMMHRLAVKALDPAGRDTLAAIQQWLDREKGKAVTPIAAQIVVKEEKPIEVKELARRVDFLLAMADNAAETVLLPPAG